MEKKLLNIQFESAAESELSAEDRRLIEEAKAATQTSFSPYSHFCVGAAVELDNGQVFRGSNQENAAFTSGLCAERTAMFYANAQYPETGVKAIAIAARRGGGTFTEEPVSPCGTCRQVLAEVEHRFHPFRVLLYGTNEVYIFQSFGELLPFQFNDSSL